MSEEKCFALKIGLKWIIKANSVEFLKFIHLLQNCKTTECDLYKQ